MKGEPKPDNIEQQVIATVTAVLQEDALWVDNRSYLARVMGKGKTGSDDYTIDEEVWRKAIVERLTALGQRLRFNANGPQRGWMYDVLWRDLNTSGDWRITNSVPLVLCCDFWVSGYTDYPSFEPLDKLLIARAEHRVLICQHKYSENAFDRFASYIEQCEITTKRDRYLLLCYVPQEKKFKYRVFLA